MSNISELNQTRGSDWPAPEHLDALRPKRNTTYPPQGRTGALLRRRPA